MPQNPGDDGLDPNEQPTKPLPQAQPDDGGADAGGDAAAGAAPSGADAPTAPFEPVTAETAQIAPHVPIADAGVAADAGGPVAGAPLAAGAVPPTGRRSPLLWILLGLVALILLAVGLAFALPLLNSSTPEPITTPTPSQSVTVPPIETPTEEPSSAPTPSDEPAPAPEPTQEPEPDPAPSEITPTTEPPITTPSTSAPPKVP